MIVDEASQVDFLAFLERRGEITPEAVQRAVSVNRKTGHAIDIVVRELGILPEASIVNALSCFLQIGSVVDLTVFEETALLERLGYGFAVEKAMLPVAIDGGELRLVVADPFDNEAIAAISYLFDLPLKLEVAARSAIEERLRQQTTNEEAVATELEQPADVDVERLLDIARDVPVVKFVAKIIQKAVDEAATDIHIEPGAEALRVRLRRDGMLTSAETAPKSLHAGIVSRLKILSRLNIAERRLPQDGRLRLPVRGQEIDFRLSVMPTVHGETIVLRILNKEVVKLELEALGYDQQAAEKIRMITGRPNGIVLVTGPTGSGKTTTLYSILAELNRPEVKIFTVEDPVEYRIAGVTQLQVDPAIGLTFASALRSVLRQDPDIILVGEIRDRETAEIAIQAALTGHMVLSTLHTNSAVGAFNRLRDMGVDAYLLDATMRGVISQRLLRTQCKACRDTDDQAQCHHCSGTGFKGRQATYEILAMSDQLSRAIVKGDGEKQLETIAKEEGMTPISLHARSLAAKNATTLAEVLRVLELDTV